MSGTYGTGIVGQLYRRRLVTHDHINIFVYVASSGRHLPQQQQQQHGRATSRAPPLFPELDDSHTSRAADVELGHWVTGSMGHLSRPGHRVIILTRCETQVFFPVFEKNAQNAKRTFEMLK